jgi:hypothetical protein
LKWEEIAKNWYWLDGSTGTLAAPLGDGTGFGGLRVRLIAGMT